MCCVFHEPHHCTIDQAEGQGGQAGCQGVSGGALCHPSCVVSAANRACGGETTTILENQIVDLGKGEKARKCCGPRIQLRVVSLGPQPRRQFPGGILYLVGAGKQVFIFLREFLILLPRYLRPLKLKLQPSTPGLLQTRRLFARCFKTLDRKKKCFNIIRGVASAQLTEFFRGQPNDGGDISQYLMFLLPGAMRAEGKNGVVVVPFAWPELPALFPLGRMQEITTLPGPSAGLIVLVEEMPETALPIKIEIIF